DTGDSYLSGHPFPGFCDPLTIGGPVTVANNPAQTLEVVGAVITGSLSLSSNHTRAIQLYASNTVGGSMTATNNHTDFQAVFVAFNTVTGVLACLNNSPFQSGQNTAGRFVGQCAP